MSRPSDEEPRAAPEGAEPGDAAPEALSLRERLIGLGARSHRKSYYPELQARLGELERFRVLLDQSEDGILLFSLPDGGLLDLNQRARRLFALPLEGTPKVTLPELVPAERRADLEAALGRGTGEPLTLDVGGATLELVVRPATFRERRFALLNARDVTARRRMEEALRRKDEELLQAQKLEAIGQLAGGIAHDFNNLLTAILGFGSTVLEQMGADDPLRPEMAELLGAAQRAGELTRQLLAFGRKQLLQPRAMDLNEIVRGTERMLQRLIGERIRYETDLSPDLGAVFMDPGQMQQVLVNLVVNARDALPAGGTIRVATRPVAGADGRASVELAVADDGVGMDEATRARIFEPFFTTKALGRGTGLGLSSVYGVVRQSGGEIRVESAPGRGTVFRVCLPRTEAPVAADAGPRRAPAPAASGVTILVAEDDALVLRFVGQTLAQAGYALLLAGDGAEALRRSEAFDGTVHALVTDVVMPGLGGPELAVALAARRPGLKVVFISGYSDVDAALERCLQEGMVLLRKPFSAQELLRVMGDVLASP